MGFLRHKTINNAQKKLHISIKNGIIESNKGRKKNLNLYVSKNISSHHNRHISIDGNCTYPTSSLWMVCGYWRINSTHVVKCNSAHYFWILILSSIFFSKKNIKSILLISSSNTPPVAQVIFPPTMVDP